MHVQGETKKNAIQLHREMYLERYREMQRMRGLSKREALDRINRGRLPKKQPVTSNT